ncbi:hypothetical protein AAY473_025278 [Plecturocebus cupreus]
MFITLDHSATSRIDHQTSKHHHQWTPTPRWLLHYATREAEAAELLEPGKRGCSQPKSCHCTPAWATGGAFGRSLGHERGALMNGISAPIKESPGSSHIPLPHEEDIDRRCRL